ncbi:MAG: methylated-DNA--[protein]-cysteine S-methyltransferase [Verrucomicrobia bacterium]|nr:MAG: methylated-DNA--[protein]-cysteine S-methyltransferase [Verrucomicrobiota bacterium]
MKNTAHPMRLAIGTKAGTFSAAYSSSGLAELSFPSALDTPCQAAAVPVSPEVAAWHALTARAVHATLSGQSPVLLPPLDLSAGSPFQQCVWRELQTLATGQTRSYGQIAAALGRPKACRAVGSACAANPLPLLIPCHRVLAAGGRLGGFSGGMDWKRRLLQAEGMGARTA